MTLVDNGLEKMTGGHPTAAAAAGVKYDELARAARLSTVAHVRHLDPLRAGLGGGLEKPGTRFV